MTLELSDQSLIVKVPDCNVAVAAATEANFRVWADGQRITSWGSGSQFCLDSWGWRSKVPDWKCAGFSTNNKGPAVWQQFDGPDVIVTLQAVELRHWRLVAGLGDVPHLNTSLATSVNKFGGVGHGHRTNDLSVLKCIDLSGMSGNPCALQGIWRKVDGLKLSITADMIRVGSERIEAKVSTRISLNKNV